jgi:hypothetical protein
MLPPHLQVDLNSVDDEASRFMSQDFFRSIREQLVKNKEPAQGEKDGK